MKKQMKERFKQVREDNKLSQSQYAKILDVDVQKVKKIEQGLTRLSIDMAKRVKKKFGRSLDWLLDNENKVTSDYLVSVLDISESDSILLARLINDPKKRNCLISLLSAEI